MQEVYLQTLLVKPSLNYVALNRAAVHDPHAFLNRSSQSDIVSMDSEAILTTAPSRIPAAVLQTTGLSQTDECSGLPPQQESGHSLPPRIAEATTVVPHMSYSVAKLLERKDNSGAAPTKRLDERSRTYASPGCGGSPTALYGPTCPCDPSWCRLGHAPPQPVPRCSGQCSRQR